MSSVRSENISRSPSERAARIRRAARALQYGAGKRDLEKSGRFTGSELDEADRMLAKDK